MSTGEHDAARPTAELTSDLVGGQRGGDSVVIHHGAQSVVGGLAAVRGLVAQ